MATTDGKAIPRMKTE